MTADPWKRHKRPLVIAQATARELLRQIDGLSQGIYLARLILEGTRMGDVKFTHIK